MIQHDPNHLEMEKRIQQMIAEDELLKELGAQMLDGSLKNSPWGWSVLVGIEREPSREIEFIDRLVDISEKLKWEQHLDVMVSPSGTKPSEWNK